MLCRPRKAFASLLPRGRFRDQRLARALSVLTLTLGTDALGASMDFALERLVTPESASCQDPGAAGNGAFCAPDQVAFKKLMHQYGMAIAPNGAYPAKTTGYAGFEILAELTITGIDSSSDAIQRGTRGSPDAATGRDAAENVHPASALPLYALRLRKGFGFGLELGGTLGLLGDTSLITGGADLRFAALEGFREGVLGYFPDVAVTGSVRTVTGASQVQLTVAGAEATFSKPFSIAKTGELTPWLGYQYLRTFGSSGVVDLTPEKSALGSNDFYNNRFFDAVSLQRHRLNLGVSYKYEILVVGAQLGLDLGSPDGDADLAGEMKQWALTLQAGTTF